MSDLAQALELEAARYRKDLQPLVAREEGRIARVDAEMARRGLRNSDAHRQAHFEARLEKVKQAIDCRIEIRRELICSSPELGSAHELKRLTQAIHEDIADLRAACHTAGLIVPPEVFSDLRERSQEAVDVLKREAAFPPPARPKPAAASVNIRAATFFAKSSPTSTITVAKTVDIPATAPPSIAPSPAAAGLDGAFRKTEEILVEVEERNARLAAALRRLAAAIKAAGKLGDERIAFLEQVQFVGEQALRPPVIRRVSVVKGLFVALREGLSEFETVSPALQAAGPLMAAHFGLKWPPVL